MTRIHLVRHGEVENPSGVVYGTLPGFGLSAHGRVQAGLAGERLAQVLLGAPLVFASPQDRARETAALVLERLAPRFPDLELAIDPRLAEAGAAFEGLPRRFAPLAYATRLLEPGVRARIERPAAVRDRVLGALLTLGSEAVIVSHQFPIRVARAALAPPPGRFATLVARRAPWLLARARCSPGSVTTLEIDAAGSATATYWEPPDLAADVRDL